MIEDVILKELTTHTDDRGFFREIFRFPEEFRDIVVGQLSHSLVKEGVIKAWHGHKEQHQWNYVVQGRIKVMLYDNCPESLTYKEELEFLAGSEDKIKAYYFPPGVLHGYKCIVGPMNIIYVTSGVFDVAEEVRIPYHNLKIRGSL